jgi:LysR family transcriptional regulator, hydrogen peroxide-inducible genes activator
MDIHHIRYFLALCETMNFTVAAERCNVAQPALSRAIRQLEDEVGGLLVRRERNGNNLTDLGLLMKPRFERVINELGQVRQQARQFLTLEKANLNVGVMCTISPTRFAGMLVHFAQAHRDITVQLSEAIPAKLGARLKNGEIDVALAASPEGFPDEFNVERLYRERFVVAFPVGHRFSGMNSVPFSEINDECYLTRINCEYYDFLDRITASHHANLPVGFASEREDWIMNMISGGIGICFIPEFSALAPGIDVRPLTNPDVWRDVCLVTRQEAPQSLPLSVSK